MNRGSTIPSPRSGIRRILGGVGRGEKGVFQGYFEPERKLSLKLTEKHIAFARVCARLEIAGQGSKVMAEECGVSRQTMYNWHKSAPFLAEKARCVAVFPG